MQSKELIAQLKRYPTDIPVIFDYVNSDSEGDPAPEITEVVMADIHRYKVKKTGVEFNAILHTETVMSDYIGTARVILLRTGH